MVASIEMETDGGSPLGGGLSNTLTRGFCVRGTGRNFVAHCGSPDVFKKPDPGLTMFQARLVNSPGAAGQWDRDPWLAADAPDTLFVRASWWRERVGQPAPGSQRLDQSAVSPNSSTVNTAATPADQLVRPGLAYFGTARAGCGKSA